MISEIEDLKADVKDGKEPKTTVRELLRWFGSQRRRTGVVNRIKSELSEAGIAANPDFTKVWIDAEVSFRKAQKAPSTNETSTSKNSNTETETADNSTASRDATFLISMLKAANCGVISVNLQDTVEKAITLMLAHDYSQLPVIEKERELKGAISWKTIGKRLSHENSINQVKDAMETASVLADTEPLFKATKTIIEEDFVFVSSPHDRRITGIVTATDLSEQFQYLSEPFLLLGQIENQIRNLLDGQFEQEALQSACNGNDPDRQKTVETVDDLTFGEYIRLIEKEENWAKLTLRVDRKVFCGEMELVRKIRNDVMHFDPDGIDDTQYDQLRRFSRLLDELEKLSNNSFA